ncbi:MAG: tRNA uridine-5-carboxymethylaminomethyl(34) synthesis GTPase MnmE [FCB group bacterium]|nr:tRNA uridine-5-carboxymethylaminomethyl(34) synthesis GTPase MnmE [FCB group bacterium]
MIRISGPQALNILKRIFIPQKQNSKPVPYMLRYGRIIGHNGSEVLDEVMAAYMPEARSFTGDEMVEVYCHSGQYTLKSILDNVLTHQCRLAEAGEFSLRRFANHGIDLTRLEGAAEVVAAKTDLAYRFSREHLLGAYGDHITDLKNRIIRLLAEIEADIDFPEEDSVGSIGREMLNKNLDEIIEALNLLGESYRTGRIVQDGYRVLILGPTNVGKSSLFNRLVRQNRALVTPVPGTTRDYLTEWIDIRGLPVELIDTAGLRRGRGRIEKAGIAETRRLIRNADLILYLFDINGRLQSFPQIVTGKKQNIIVVLNKADLLTDRKAGFDKWIRKIGSENLSLMVSAKTGLGLKKLLGQIHDSAGIADLTDSRVVTSHRHKTKIDNCLKHLIKIRSASGQPTEIISFELRRAADQIGEITGQVYTEEILDEIFSNFCIGK